MHTDCRPNAPAFEVERMADNDTIKDLALPTSGALFTALASAFELTTLPALVGIGATVIAEGVKLADRLGQQRQRKKADRFIRLYHLLTERVEKLEEQVYSEEEVDLFLSVMQNALEDDEENKEPFYVAALEWMIKEKPPAVHVRILSDAVRNLSYLELYCFLAEHSGVSTRLHQSDLDEVVLWNRLAGAGLSSDAGVRFKADATALGIALARHCDVTNLEKPPGWSERRR